MTDTLIKNLQNPNLFDHPVEYFKVMQTHISWVILTGKFAYKIKKPVDFQVLDFSTLEKRKFCCEEELRLNKALAPKIYLEIVPITGSEENPQINGRGPVIEYVIKMLEFPQASLYSNLLEKNILTRKHMTVLARTLANFHLHAHSNSPPGLGTPAQVHQPVIQNFEQIRSFLINDASKEDTSKEDASKEKELKQLEKLEEWANAQYTQLLDVFQKRKTSGFIRECHGDLHFGNIVQLEQKPVVFDCIEFNPSFRWTDVMADIGFLLMDLHKNHAFIFANTVLNYYLQETNDYAGLQILPYYQAYRAMVRAKVNLFNWTQVVTESEKNDLFKQYQQFANLAESYIHPRPPFLLITHGFSGSGKSTLAKYIAEAYGAIHIRSDIERKRLAGLKSMESSGSQVLQGIYHSELTEQTYAQLNNLAKLITAAHYPVVVDATFLKKHHRENFATLAKQLQVPFIILNCASPVSASLARIKRRRESISEANEEVLQMQQVSVEPLSAEEIEHYHHRVITIEMLDEHSIDDLGREIDQDLEKMIGSV